MAWTANMTDRYGALFNAPILRSSEVVQIGRGNLNASYEMASGADSFFHYIASDPLFSATQFGDLDWVGVILAVSRTGVHTVNGADVSDWRGYFIDGREAYCSVGEKRDNFIISIRRRRLQQTLMSILGATEARFDLTARPLNLGRAFMEHLRALTCRCIASAMPVRPGSRASFVPPAIEADAIAEVSALLLPFLDGKYRASPRQQCTARIVEMARDALTAAPNASIGLADLCAASGVGITRLHEAFVEIYGVSAGRYLHQLRLTMAREALLDRHAPPRSVKDVALSFGFVSSGRFAQYYRRLFDENPSTTLQRSEMHRA